MSGAPRLRTATLADAAAIARLATQLGYPVTEAAMVTRLAKILASPEHVVFVAELDGGPAGVHGNAPGDGIAGWIAGEIRHHVEADARAEITGLVVEAGARRAGVGRALIEEVERWATRLGHRRVVVRSNAARVESHPFYLKRGYARAKTQHVYEKVLRD